MMTMLMMIWTTRYLLASSRYLYHLKSAIQPMGKQTSQLCPPTTTTATTTATCARVSLLSPPLTR